MIEEPIAYVGRKLTSAESRYSTTELELLAVLFGLQKCRTMLASPGPVEVTVDHKNLCGVSASESNRIVRWRQSLAEFDVCLEYRAGSSNCVADCLSRLSTLPATSDVSLPSPRGSGGQTDADHGRTGMDSST